MGSFTYQNLLENSRFLSEAKPGQPLFLRLVNLMQAVVKCLFAGIAALLAAIALMKKKKDAAKRETD